MLRFVAVLFFIPLSVFSLPLHFELNQGQFYAPGVVLTASGPRLSGGIRMALPGAHWSAPRPDGPSTGHTDHFSSAPRRSVPNYAGVRYAAVYPGIDLVFHAAPSGLEYDFVLAPGADPGAIRMRFPGASSVSLVSGELTAGPLRHRRPLAYQESAGVRRYVDASYRLIAGDVAFDLAPWDRTLPLTIDPVLVYATYAGGSTSETATAIVTDAVGNAYLAGATDSSDFTIVTAKPATGLRGFVAKLNPTGANVTASLALAGGAINGMAIDATGNLVVVGEIAGSGFPAATTGAYQQSGATGFVAKFSQDTTGFKNVFISSFAATPMAVALDPSGNIYVTGFAGTSFQTTPGVIQGSNYGGSCIDGFGTRGACPDAFVLKLSADGSREIYGTYLGGGAEDTGRAIAVNAAGEVYIAGDTVSAEFRTTPGAFQTKFGGMIRGDGQNFGDAFLSKLDATGANLIFSTFLGGGAPDVAYAVAVDKDGNAYVAGGTQSPDFPVTSGVLQPKYAGGTALAVAADPAGDAFLAKFSSSGARVWATFLGGSSRELAAAIVLDSAGDIFVAGSSESADFPWTTGAVRGCRNGGPFVAEFDNAGAHLLRTSSTGGMGLDEAHAIAIDSSANVYLGGDTTSRPFFSSGSAAQKIYGGGDTDAFAAKLDLQNSGRTYVACVLNAASFQPGNFDFYPQGTVAPGEIVSIFGNALGPDTPALAQPAPGAPYPNTLGGTQVFFDGIAAPMWYVSPTQINAVVPYGVKAPTTQMTVQRAGITDGPRALPVANAVPGVFTATGTGQGQAAVFNQDGSFNSVANPAPRGSVIVFYGVGAGIMTPAETDGSVQPGTLPLPAPVANVTVQIRGVNANVLYAGAAPGYISGLLQINVQIPDSIEFGNSVPLALNIGGQTSQFNLTIAVK